LNKLPLLCQLLDDVRPIPNHNSLDFRSFITNDLKLLSSSDSISDKQVLILTRKFDPEATRVSIKLMAKGIDSVRLNVEDIPKQMRVRYQIGDVSDPRIEFTIGDRNFNSCRFPVVWLRDFDSTLMGFDFGDKYNKLAKRFCYEQWNDSYQILIDGLASEWINRPEANLKASNRLMQLAIAREVGFKIPSTLITNDPNAAAGFYQKHDGQIILKALHHHGIEIEGKVYSMYTHSLTKDSLSRLDDLIYAPCILQGQLNKKSELRVTIVGDKVFAAELDTQTIPNCRDDLHRGKLSEIPKKAVKLDSETETSCLKMMNTFGLKYCAFDFILNENNPPYFLEINPSGDWYWIEHDTKLAITDTMVNLIETLVSSSNSSSDFQYS
jgi:glutathione synthase/RimK-type ligase-like ATP-grasp enzyme